MNDDEILLTGRRSAPQPARLLRAGALELELDGADVRRVAYRGIEVVGQIYFAFRDVPWNTLPGIVSDMRVDEGPGPRFEASFRSRHAYPALGLDLEYLGSIVGTESGGLTYTVAVAALTPIEYNRIGLNLVHGARTYAGRPYRSWLADAPFEGELPLIVGPQAVLNGRLRGLSEPFDHLELSPLDGVVVDLRFEGDEFEIEDQRNFGDGSFKTYSTPLQRPSPFRLEQGETVRQSVRIAVRDERPAEKRVHRASAPTRLRLGGQTGQSVPAFGLGQVDDDLPLTDAERARVSALQPHHLRVELVIADGVERCLARLRATAAEAGALGCDLWVDLTASSDDAADLAAVTRSLAEVQPTPSAIYLATTITEPPDQGESARLLASVKAIAAKVAPRARVGAGAFMFFAELNRAPFDGAAVEHLTFASSPTVHRTDDDTVLENLDHLGDAVVAARRSLGDRSLSVGPITLAARHGPYPNGPTGPGDLPARVDLRQPSLLAAAMTVGHLAEFGRAGVEALTFFETAGWMGVIERDAGSKAPDRFHSDPGSVFPSWHVLADAAEWRGMQLLEISLVPAPVFSPRVASVAVRGPEGDHLLVSSLSRTPIGLILEGLTGTSATIRSLDTSSARAAMRDPEAFRASGAGVAMEQGRMHLDLAPYATVRIDIPR